MADQVEVEAFPGALAATKAPVPVPTISEATVKIRMGSVYWGVLLANLTAALIYSIVRYLLTL